MLGHQVPKSHCTQGGQRDIVERIAYGRQAGDCAGLILPHPRAAERLFVMGPLAEIAPEWAHPGGGVARVLAARATIGADARPLA